MGDVVVIDTGDILCADGILIPKYGYSKNPNVPFIHPTQDMKTDESAMTGEIKQMAKTDADPFLLSSTMVLAHKIYCI